MLNGDTNGTSIGVLRAMVETAAAEATSSISLARDTNN